jgi:hypothetical protein
MCDHLNQLLAALGTVTTLWRGNGDAGHNASAMIADRRTNGVNSDFEILFIHCVALGTDLVQAAAQLISVSDRIGCKAG